MFNFLTGAEMPIIVVPSVEAAVGEKFFVNARLGDPMRSEFDATLARQFGIGLQKKDSELLLGVAEVQRIAEVLHYPRNGAHPILFC